MENRSIREVTNNIIAAVPAEYVDKLVVLMAALPTGSKAMYLAPEQLRIYWDELVAICNYLLEGERPPVTDWKVKMISVLTGKPEEWVRGHDHTEASDFENKPSMLTIPLALKGMHVHYSLDLIEFLVKSEQVCKFYEQPFVKEMIKEYFKWWELDTGGGYTNYSTDKNKKLWHNIYFTPQRFTLLECSQSNNVVMQGILPMNLDQFIYLMKICGVDLIWKAE
jgi:hypothetical protein